MKKTIRLIAFLLLLCASASFAEVNITACDYAASTAGELYMLNASVTCAGNTNGVNITAQNVTLDCNGFSLIGLNASSTHGIYSNQFNTTVKNCNISNFDNAIYFNGAINGTIQNNTVPFGKFGSSTIRLSNTNGSMVVGNNITGYDYAISAGANSIVENNTVLITNGNAADSFGYALSSNAIARNNTFRTTAALASIGFLITGENVSIDCLGGSIVGSNQTSSYGIYSTQFNTTIRNCNISNFQHGIYFSGANNGLIQNNNASTTRASGYGIYLSSSSNNILTNSTATSTSGNAVLLTGNSSSNTFQNGNYSCATTACVGFYILNGTNNTVNNANINATGVGLYLDASANNNLIENSTINSANNTALLLSSANGSTNNNVLRNNTAIANANSYGCYILRSGGNLFDRMNCTVSNASSAYAALALQNFTNSSGNTIANSTFTGTAGQGILFTTAGNNNLINNTASSSSGYGLHFTSSSNNSLSNNVISSSANTATRMETGSENNTFANYTSVGASGSGVGLLSTTSANTFNGCTLTSNGGGFGLWINNSNNNVIANCTINGNTTHAAFIAAGTGNQFFNITLATPSGRGAHVTTNSHNTLFSGIGTGGINMSGIHIDGGSNVSVDCFGRNIIGSNTAYGIYSSQFNTTIRNCNISNFQNGIRFEGASNSSVQNNNLSSTFMSALFVGSDAQNNTFISNVLNSSTVGININNGSSNTFRNNTIYAGSVAVNVSAASGNNLFYWNNVTATLLVNNSNATNQFNTTNATGTPQGNYWYAQNGTGVWLMVQLIDANNDTYSDTGSAYPLNATNAPAGMWAGLGADWGAYTNVTNTAPVMNSSRILPLPAYVTDTLRGYCNATDKENNSVYYYYSYFLNGALNASGITANYSQGVEINVANVSSALLVKGQNWTLQCTPFDGILNGTATNTSIVISNSAPVCLNFTYSTLNPVQVQRIWVNATCADADMDAMNVSTCWKINGVNDVLNTCKVTQIGGNSTANFSAAINYSYSITTASYITRINSTNTSNVTNPLYASDNNFATYATAAANANISLNFSNTYIDGTGAQADVKLINVTGYCYNGTTFASFITPNGTLQEQYFSLPAACFSQAPIQIRLGMNASSVAYDIGLLINRTQTIYPILNLANYTAYGNVSDGTVVVNLSTNSTPIKPVKSPQFIPYRR